MKVQAARPVPILTYHQIAEAPGKPASYRSLYVAPPDFARQMAWLKSLGYQGLSMSELMPYLQGEKTGRVVGITFDDGYLNNLTDALPVLQQHGFSATCYFVSRRLGHSNDWDRAIGIKQTRLMGQPQVREWVAGGQEAGAHTRTHPRLLGLNKTEAQQEIAGSKLELEAVTGKLVQHFCYPFGEFDRQHVQMVQEAGYQTATTTQRGRARRGDALLQLPRATVARATNLAGLWFKVATPYEDRGRR